MDIKIIKRNGELVAFDKNKIINALRMASNKIQQTKDRINEKEIKEIAEFIEFKAQSRKKSFSVEEIQDIIESELMHRGFKAVAKEYITYRYMHKLARERYQDLMKAMDVKLRAKDVQNQNANVDEKSFGGRVGESSDYMMKQYALDYCMSPLARNNHLNNLIYTHDLSAYAVGMHNCLTIPFDKLLREGFNTRQTDVRPAGSINTALQLVAVIFQLQSLQQFGGVSASHIDWTLVPYFRKSFLKHYKNGLKYIARTNVELKYDKNTVINISIDDEYWKQYPDVFEYALDMTVNETYQAVEAMYHNLNTLQSRSGNQLPFTSINYGTCTLTEGRLIIKAILDVSIKGIGKTQKTSIFPCGIFQVMKGVNKEPGTPNYDLFKLALKSTSQRLYPNYCNVNWSNAAGYDINDPSTYNSTMRMQNC